jgi:hypothetical protein
VAVAVGRHYQSHAHGHSGDPCLQLSPLVPSVRHAVLQTRI